MAESFSDIVEHSMDVISMGNWDLCACIAIRCGDILASPEIGEMVVIMVLRIIFQMDNYQGIIISALFVEKVVSLHYVKMLIMFKEKVVSSLIGTLFFAVLQPFNFSQFGWIRFLLYEGVFVVSLVSCVVSELLVGNLLGLKVDMEKGPTYAFRRGLTFQLVNVSLLTVGLCFFLDTFASNEQVDNHLSWRLLLWVVVYCVGASVVIGLYWRNVYWRRFYTKQQQEVDLLNGMLLERARFTEEAEVAQSVAVADTASDPVVLLEGGTKDCLSFSASRFLFAEAEGNYVSVCWLEDGLPKQSLLRTSIKNVVSTLAECGTVMQCHRAFVVNLCQVEAIEGRSSGIGLVMKHCEKVVPVSKSYVAEVKNRIKNPVRLSPKV